MVVDFMENLGCQSLYIELDASFSLSSQEEGIESLQCLLEKDREVPNGGVTNDVMDLLEVVPSSSKCTGSFKKHKLSHVLTCCCAQRYSRTFLI